MTAPLRVVFDTNVLVSAALTATGKPWLAVEHVLTSEVPLLSSATFEEIAEVMNRPRLRTYLPDPLRARFLDRLSSAAVWIEPSVQVEVCRDPKDDKFLSLALAGSASVIVSGDADLLELHPFQGVQNLSPAAFLESVGV